MRKQMKIAAVVSAAALLALGASITSFAAQRGTWKYEDGEWYCYNRNGDVYENTFCLSNGKEFYVGDDGMMVRSSWVEYDGDYYFVNSAGQKITNDWRLTTPYDDEEAEEQWFYFQSTGKRAEDKKLTIKGKTYFFDSDGKMFTGWVQDDGDSYVEASEGVIDDANPIYYCDETGARLEKAWVKDYAPGVDEDDSDADEYWFYLKSNGKVATGKQSNIKGQTYFFDNEGKMLIGWVATTATDSNSYETIQGTEDDDSFTPLKSISEGGREAYYCGHDEDDGHMKKNKWIKLWNPEDAYDQDEDNDQYWFYLDKNGKVYIPSGSDATVQKYKFEEGKLVKSGSPIGVTQKRINGKDYFLNEEGEMISKFFRLEEDTAELKAGLYYLGGSDDGVMKTGSQSIKDDVDDTYKFYFETKGDDKGVGYTGNKSGKLYYDGKLITADDYKYEIATVNGYNFVINQSGSIQHSKTEYKEDGDVLVDCKEAKDGAAVAFYTSKDDIAEEYEDSLKTDLGNVKYDTNVFNAAENVYE